MKLSNISRRATKQWTMTSQCGASILRLQEGKQNKMVVSLCFMDYLVCVDGCATPIHFSDWMIIANVQPWIFNSGKPESDAEKHSFKVSHGTRRLFMSSARVTATISAFLSSSVHFQPVPAVSLRQKHTVATVTSKVC